MLRTFPVLSALLISLIAPAAAQDASRGSE
jgi:hypothetical protein